MSETGAEEKDRLGLILQAQKGDKTAKEKLLRENSGLIYLALKRFSGMGRDREELYQVGAIGLLRAAEKFDPSSGYAFSTYAVPMIIGEIRRFLRDDQPIHISRPIRENAGKICRAREQWEKTHSREISLLELSQQTGLTREEVILAVEAMGSIDSLDRPMSSSKGGEKDQMTTLADRIPDCADVENTLIDRLAVRQLTALLSKEDQRLVELRYEQNLSQTRTAQVLGTNQAAISRREKKILQSLRRQLSS